MSQKHACSLLAVQIFNASEQLHKAEPSICLIVGSTLQHSIQQLSASQQLCNEVHLVTLLKVLLQEDDVLVIHAHQNVYLLEDVLPARTHHWTSVTHQDVSVPGIRRRDGVAVLSYDSDLRKPS